MGATTAVFLGEKTLSVVAGRSAARGVELTHAASAPLPEGYAALEGEAQADALRAALEAAGVGTRRAVLVVPRPLAILRTFTIPSGTPEELQSMIRFQLEKDLPLPLDQLRYSYATKVEDGRVSVTVAAVPIEALDKRIAALEKAGLHITGAVVTSFGLIRLLPPGDPEGGSLLLSLADGGAEILIAESGRIHLSRSTPLRDQDSEGWAAEIDRAIHSHSAKGAGVDLKRVFVAGEGDPADQVASELKRRMPAADVTSLVPNGTVTRAADVRITAECAATAGVIVGLLAPKTDLPDLLKAHVIRRAITFKRSHKIAAAAGLLVVTLLVGSQIALAGRRSEAESLRKKHAGFKPTADSVDRMRAEIETLQQWQDRRFAWIDLLDQLQRRLPAGKIHLASFSADEQGIVRLAGKAKDNAAARDFATELQKMRPAFSEVGEPSIRLNDGKSEYKNDFDIRVTLADLAPKKKEKPAPAPKKKL
ncbi:MAG TPA: PilN domain-containing protein [Planctomycetota bacterium]|nr:PilN domain-containing protein [Planctomycetota bacterium]